MLRAIDESVREWVAWCLAMLGLGLSYLSEWCIRSAAWVAQIDWNEVE